MRKNECPIPSLATSQTFELRLNGAQAGAVVVDRGFITSAPEGLFGCIGAKWILVRKSILAMGYTMERISYSRPHGWRARTESEKRREIR